MGSNASTWDVILHYWTVTMFVPAILLVIATLAVITRVGRRLDRVRRAADLGAADVALADRGVRLVVGTVVDMAGVTRAKAVPRDRLAAFVQVGMGASPSWNVFCVDFGVAFTPPLGVTGDLRLRIDPETADGRRRRRRLGARRPPRAGRRAVPRVSAVAAADASRAGPVDRAARVDGRRAGVRPRDARRVGAPARHVAGLRGAVGAGRRARSWPTSRPTFAAAGVPVEQLHAEYGADQFEISLAPADPLAPRTGRCWPACCSAGSRRGTGSACRSRRSRSPVARATARTCTCRSPAPRARCSPAAAARTA